MLPWVFLAILAPLDIKREIAVIVMQLWITCEKVPVLFSDTIYFLGLSQRNLRAVQRKNVNFNATSPSVTRNWCHRLMVKALIHDSIVPLAPVSLLHECGCIAQEIISLDKQIFSNQ